MVQQRKNISTHIPCAINRYWGDTRERKGLHRLISQQTWEFWPQDSIESVLKDSHGLLFYTTDLQGQWTGLAFAQCAFDSSELLYIYSRPDQRGQGLGRKLLQHLIAHLKQTGNQEALFLEVRPSNTHALKLYQSFGWKLTHQRERYYQDGEDALVYKLDL